MTSLPSTNLFPPRLCIEGFHGREYLSIVHTPGPSPDMDWNRRYMDLSPELAALSLAELRKLFQAGQLEIKPRAWNEAHSAEAKKRADLIYRVVRIIQESKFRPEVEEFKAYYQRIVGEPYVGKEGGM
jgi:hypothetical protein